MSIILYERIGGRKKIATLVRNFYSTLQLDPTLGPVFAAHVADWPAHYAKLTDFWTVQTGGPATYRGRLIQAHERLPLGREHYAIWLAQWKRSCRLHFEPPEADEMAALADALARRMPGNG